MKANVIDNPFDKRNSDKPTSSETFNEPFTFHSQIPELLHLPALTPRPGLSHLPLTNPRAYYRSKIFIVANGINPLIAAAACLLTTAAYLRTAQNIANVRELYQELEHEIRAFETQTQTQGYRSELILVARYILCATIDEIILTTSWGVQSDWSKHKLLTIFHNEDWGGERFFVILERLSADAALHIDVLELIYLCLNLGFTGKFSLLENSLQQLNKITDELYQIIRWQRGDLKKELLIQDKNVAVKPAVTVSTEPLPLWLLGGFICILLFSFFVVFDYQLGNHTNALFQQINTYAQ